MDLDYKNLLIDTEYSKALEGGYVSNLLTDKPLEEYFKNFLLSDHCKKYYRPKTKDYEPSAYTKLLIGKKKELVDDEDYEETLMHPQDAEARLFDITTCKTIEFEPYGKTKVIDPNVGAGGSYKGMVPSHIEKETESYTIRIGFNHFFQSVDQAEYGAYIFDDTVNDATPIDIDMFDEPIKEGNELVLNVRIPKKYRKFSNQLLIVARLVIDPVKKMYFPHPLLKDAGYERWMGAKVLINKKLYFTDNFMDTEDIKFNKLKNVGNWQNLLVRTINGTEKDE